MGEITYGRLDDVLRSLGFAPDEPEPGTRVYRHPRSGASITFPILPARDHVREHHMVATRMTLELFGIADPPVLASMLQKAG